MDAALRHVHALLLQDLRPPWMTEPVSKLLPAETTLARYALPCFLHWPAEVTVACFGEATVRLLQQQTEEVTLTFTGVVGRPLYTCTAFNKDEKDSEALCGAPASMSPLLTFPEERKAWRCSACLERGAPVSDSVPRRTIRLYPLVKAIQTQEAPMRAKPLLVHLFVPPATFGWGHSSPPLSSASSAAGPIAVPGGTLVQDAQSRTVIVYTQAESDDIWLTAGRYNKEPSLDTLS